MSMRRLMKYIRRYIGKKPKQDEDTSDWKNIPSLEISCEINQQNILEEHHDNIPGNELVQEENTCISFSFCNENSVKKQDFDNLESHQMTNDIGMDIVIINDIEYIVLGDVFFNKAPVYCKQSHNSRELMRKKKIMDFIFAREIKEVWTITDGNNKKLDKVLLKKTFIYTIPEFNFFSPISELDIKTGTQIIQNDDLTRNVLGVNANVIKNVFNTSTNILPCVYLFTLGFVKDLRESMNIDASYKDDDVVAKYGFTKDLARRTGEHIVNFGKITNVNLRLKYNSYIDPQYMSRAESDIRLFMTGLKLNHEWSNHEELVIIPKDLNKLVEQQYGMIGKKYMGYISELVSKIKELDEKYEKLTLTHQIEIQNEKHAREMQRETYETELLKKSFEILIINKKNTFFNFFNYNKT